MKRWLVFYANLREDDPGIEVIGVFRTETEAKAEATTRTVEERALAASWGWLDGGRAVLVHEIEVPA